MRDGNLMWVQITHCRPGSELEPEPDVPLPTMPSHRQD